MDELLPCPFCGCEVRIQSNRDWHSISDSHDEDCVLSCCADIFVPATDDHRAALIDAWNTRKEARDAES